MLISKFNNENIELDIQNFEEKYTIVMPQEYKKFLMKYNGGQTPKTKFKINQISSDLRGFFGLGEAEKNFSLNLFFADNDLQEYISDEVIPIAKNSYGDYIFTGVGKDKNGIIFFKYHDRLKRYLKVSDNLSSFVSRCKSEQIGHVRSIEERRISMISKGREEFITADLISTWQAEIDKYTNINQEEVII